MSYTPEQEASMIASGKAFLGKVMSGDLTLDEASQLLLAALTSLDAQAYREGYMIGYIQGVADNMKVDQTEDKPFLN